MYANGQASELGDYGKYHNRAAESAAAYRRWLLDNNRIDRASEILKLAFLWEEKACLKAPHTGKFSERTESRSKIEFNN